MIKNFNFTCMPEVTSGRNSISQLPELVKKFKGSRLLLVADKYFATTLFFKEIEELLKESHIDYFLFDKVSGEPSTDLGDDCASLGAEKNCDIVCGIGGGSTLDTAKAAAILITNGGKIQDYQGLNKVPKPGLPKIMVPTTAGTGSEVTFTSVFIRTLEKKKGGINSPFLYPEATILDPVLTMTVPPAVTASTGLDALCHAVESFTSRKANLMSETVSLRAMKLIWDNLSVVYHNGEDLKARESMLYGSFLAGVGLANAGVTAVHSISYPLGGMYKVPHGIGNGLLMPFVLEFNMPEIQDTLALAANFVNAGWTHLNDKDKSMRFIEYIKNLVKEFNIPSLKELNIPEESFETMADDALKIAVPIENNPKPVKKSDIVEIYKKAFYNS